MPYTPPARSPVSSGTVSPSYSRSQIHRSSPPRSPSGRPDLPRSASSAAYLQKSRRSPAYSVGSQSPRVDTGKPDWDTEDGLPSVTNPSLRQSPPPISDSTQIPPGAIISPPDSTQNSSDDEENAAGLQMLEEDVRRTLAIDKEAESPEETSPMSNTKDLKLETFSALNNHARFSPSARKISHSRSATEASFFERRGSSSSHTTTSSDDDDDDDRFVKPPLLRKKSGELVKPAIRPSSRRRHSSMPGTPTYSKAVHFNDQIEQVRHFLQVDKPIAVSAGASPIDSHDDETEFPFHQGTTPPTVAWEIRVSNFPRMSLERVSMPVRLEQISLSRDEKHLIGVVAVANLSFHKAVVARFTLDYWKTTSEIGAEYSNDVRYQNRDDGCDIFTFTIKLSDQANLETRTLLLCVRYNVNGQEFWDSNDGQNYQVDFVKNVTQSVASSSGQSKPASQVGARPIPRSRHNSSSSSRGRALHSLNDDFSSSFDDSTSNIRLRNHSQTVPSLPTTPPPLRKPTSGGPQFGVRYDFGASLSAALSQAQAQLGERSGITLKRPEALVGGTTSKGAAQTGPPSLASALGRRNVGTSSTSGVESPRPEALLANKQSLDSRAYQDFVSKFCFFGSGKNPSQVNAGQPASGTDGAHDEVNSTSIDGEGNKKADPSKLTAPAIPNGTSQVPQGLSPNSSGTSSPTAATGSRASPRGLSPSRPSNGFPFHHDGRRSLFTETQMPTAIHG